MKKLGAISRWLLAIVFLFSAFVKGVDPLGTSYKIEDYLLAYHMDWALFVSLPAAFALIGFEFSLGVFLLFNLYPRLTRYGTALLMAFFTLVTLYDALYNPVPDCGCFGDALILTNWQTFYKNLLIDALLILVFLFHSKQQKRKSYLWGLLVFSGFIAFSYYNYRHLPILDFRSWKEGTQVFDASQNQTQLFVTYQNKNTGEQKEYLSPNFPYQDSVWMAEWEFVSLREYNPNQNNQQLMLFDDQGQEATADVLGFSGQSFLIISNNIRFIGAYQLEKIQQIIQLAETEQLSIVFITASVEPELSQFLTQNQIDIPVYQADDIDLKTIIRSNPGLILLENGKVMQKWSWVDFPTEINQIPN